MKYIIEIENEPFGRNDDPVIPHGMDELYRAKGFKSLVFDKNGLDKLIPYTEPDRDRKAIENEVWEFLNFFTGMSPKERYECFDKVFSHMIVSTMSYREAKAKYEAWLKQNDEIHVGDELKDDGNIRAVVLDIMDEDYVSYEVFTENGIVDEWQKGIVVKTGRHFDEVAELLKKMRGDSE